MNTLVPSRSRSPTTGGRSPVSDYYLGRLRGFGAEDPALSLHFGYWARGLNPFVLAPMLDRMTSEVVDMLRLDDSVASPTTLLDVGCGRGRPALLACRSSARIRVVGVDLMLLHALSAGRWARQQAAKDVSSAGTHFLTGDYQRLPLGDRSGDAAMVIEAICHCPDVVRSPVFSEIARVLRPGAPVVFSEPLSRRPSPDAGPGSVEARICRALAIQQLVPVDDICARLESVGLVDIERREVTWRLAPSAVLLQQRLAGQARQRRHALVVLAACGLGLLRRHGYYLIRARRA